MQSLDKWLNSFFTFLRLVLRHAVGHYSRDQFGSATKHVFLLKTFFLQNVLHHTTRVLPNILGTALTAFHSSYGKTTWNWRCVRWLFIWKISSSAIAQMPSNAIPSHKDCCITRTTAQWILQNVGIQKHRNSLSDKCLFSRLLWWSKHPLI